MEPVAARRPAGLARLDAGGRIDLKGLDLDGLTTFCADALGEHGSLARRIFRGLWVVGARSVDELPDVSAATRARLNELAFVSMLRPVLVLRSDDGTFKYLWELHDGHRIESVLIPDGDRLTLCMSSQVGCAMACTFCLTGDLGLKRHLDPAEIAGQALQVQRQIDGQARITNIVMMGMGEPLHNLDALCTALRICLDDRALNFSSRRVTVSTVGLVPQMGELARRLPVQLAVSLNASTEARRKQIMPITKRYSLEQLMDACRAFPLTRGRKIVFEYVMFEGDNDADDDADRLVALLADVPAKVNLIPYNQNPERDLRPPSPERVRAFADRLIEGGLLTTIRATRGRDISAACGQLGKAWQQAKDQGWLLDARRVAGVEA